MTWQPVKNYIEQNMKVKHTDEEPIYFQEYEPEALENIIDTQHKIITYMKNKIIKIYQILIIIDDFADHEKMQAFKVIKSVIY